MNGLSDGLYRIDSGSFCAGFELERGRVVAIAPCLRKILPFVIRQAKLVAPARVARRKTR